MSAPSVTPSFHDALRLHEFVDRIASGASTTQSSYV